MQKYFKISTLMFAVVLTACGGGGGSSGTTQESYEITLRAEKTQLPLNTGGNSAGKGVYSPYTSILYVESRIGGKPIPGGDEVFACNLSGGLDSGSLYYLDGDPKHEKEVDDGFGGKVTVPLAYRSVVLGANSGGNSFHFHAGNQAGTARITCAVTDPRDKQQKSASVNITVGASTGKAASIRTVAEYPTLGSQGNLQNLRTSTSVEVFVLDDANQPVPASAKANLQATIVSSRSANGARLFAGDQSGSVVQVQTVGGVGRFSLSSGSIEGPILLQVVSDRFDNDISNGIQDPIAALYAVTATEGNSPGMPPEALSLMETSPPGGTNGLPYSYAFGVTGGVAPYTWTALGRLPDGLVLSSSGILSGTPSVDKGGDYNVAVRVTDSRGVFLTTNLSIGITVPPPPPPLKPIISPLSINLSGCGSDVNTSCALPDAQAGSFYQYVLTTTGGEPGNVVWAFEPDAATLPWLSITSSGILQGTVPATCGALGNPFFIKATKGEETVIRKVTIKGVAGPRGNC